MDPQSLFESRRLRLAPHDPERDAEIESRWTHDLEYQRQIGAAPARPLSPGQAKKRLEALEKEARESKNLYAFAVRTLADDRLIGFAHLSKVDQVHGAAELSLGLGAPEDRGQGYGGEALRLILRYAFGELNLHRLQAVAGQDNPGAIRFLERAGFSLEVRRRQALQRGDQACDELWLGLLRDEWERLRAAEEASHGR